MHTWGPLYVIACISFKVYDHWLWLPLFNPQDFKLFTLSGRSLNAINSFTLYHVAVHFSCDQTQTRARLRVRSVSLTRVVENGQELSNHNFCIKTWLFFSVLMMLSGSKLSTFWNAIFCPAISFKYIKNTVFYPFKIRFKLACLIYDKPASILIVYEAAQRRIVVMSIFCTIFLNYHGQVYFHDIVVFTSSMCSVCDPKVHYINIRWR